MSDSELSQGTLVFGLHLWELVGIGVGAAFVLLLVLLSLLCLLASRRRRRRRAAPVLQLPVVVPNAQPKHPAAKPPKDIQEVPSRGGAAAPAAAPAAKAPLAQVLQAPPPDSIQIETGKEHRITFPEQPPPPHHQRSGGPSSRGASGESRGGGGEPGVPEVSHLGWGHWYTLKELEDATCMFADEKVIGEGGYGIVYHGVLEGGVQVAVKNLLNNRY
jgi:hypothetical protein